MIASRKCESLNSYFALPFLLNNESWRLFVWVRFDIQVVIYINSVQIFINYGNFLVEKVFYNECANSN